MYKTKIFVTILLNSLFSAQYLSPSNADPVEQSSCMEKFLNKISKQERDQAVIICKKGSQKRALIARVVVLTHFDKRRSRYNAHQHFLYHNPNLCDPEWRQREILDKELTSVLLTRDNPYAAIFVLDNNKNLLYKISNFSLIGLEEDTIFGQYREIYGPSCLIPIRTGSSARCTYDDKTGIGHIYCHKPCGYPSTYWFSFFKPKPFLIKEKNHTGKG